MKIVVEIDTEAFNTDDSDLVGAVIDDVRVEMEHFLSPSGEPNCAYTLSVNGSSVGTIRTTR